MTTLRALAVRAALAIVASYVVLQPGSVHAALSLVSSQTVDGYWRFNTDSAGTPGGLKLVCVESNGNTFSCTPVDAPSPFSPPIFLTGVATKSSSNRTYSVGGYAPSVNATFDLGRWRAWFNGASSSTVYFKDLRTNVTGTWSKLTVAAV